MAQTRETKRARGIACHLEMSGGIYDSAGLWRLPAKIALSPSDDRTTGRERRHGGEGRAYAH
jgi:hypothetical protein